MTEQKKYIYLIPKNLLTHDEKQGLSSAPTDSIVEITRQWELERRMTRLEVGTLLYEAENPEELVKRLRAFEHG